MDGHLGADVGAGVSGAVGTGADAAVVGVGFGAGVAGTGAFAFDDFWM